MQHAWKGYRASAWGHDHLHPISHQSDDWFHLGLSILDAVDTLYIMGLKDGELSSALDFMTYSYRLGPTTTIPYRLFLHVIFSHQVVLHFPQNHLMGYSWN